MNSFGQAGHNLRRPLDEKPLRRATAPNASQALDSRHQGHAHIVYEPGQLYPHNNLHYITATTWDLHALQAVLLPGLTRLFIATYSTKMRGSFLRFQAQYLRRIPMPEWAQVPSQLRHELVQAALLRDVAACNVAVGKRYGLSVAEMDKVPHQHPSQLARSTPRCFLDPTNVSVHIFAWF